MALAWVEVESEFSVTRPLMERQALAVLANGVNYLRTMSEEPTAPELLADGAPGVGDLLFMQQKIAPAEQEVTGYRRLMGKALSQNVVLETDERGIVDSGLSLAS